MRDCTHVPLVFEHVIRNKGHNYVHFWTFAASKTRLSVVERITFEGGLVTKPDAVVVKDTQAWCKQLCVAVKVEEPLQAEKSKVSWKLQTVILTHTNLHSRRIDEAVLRAWLSFRFVSVQSRKMQSWHTHSVSCSGSECFPEAFTH